MWSEEDFIMHGWKRRLSARYSIASPLSSDSESTLELLRCSTLNINWFNPLQIPVFDAAMARVGKRIGERLLYLADLIGERVAEK